MTYQVGCREVKCKERVKQLLCILDQHYKDYKQRKYFIKLVI